MKIIGKIAIAIFGCMSVMWVNAAEVPEDIYENDSLWMNWHLYHGVSQRGGPYKFTDTYFEIEFGGRSGILDLYGYVDFKDIFNDSSSDANNGANLFADIEPRLSLDYMFGKDLSIGPVKEWFLAFDLYYADNECAQTCVNFEDDGSFTPGTDSSGLKILWVGIGTNTEVPWMGTMGINVYSRYIWENYGASNEGGFDGYAVHLNWFRPIHSFDNGSFLAFQGYFDYEFGSDMPEKGNAFEQQYRSDNSLQSYLGIWYHWKHIKLGYGAKVYRNMTQWEDGNVLAGRKTDTTGVGHYFNIGYSF